MPTRVTLDADPNAKIPAAAKAASARANEIHAAAYGKAEAPSSEPTSLEAAAASPEPALAPEPAPAPAVEPAPVEAGGNPAGNQPRNWEHDFKSMKGRFDRSEAEKRDLINRMGSLQDRLSTLETAPQARPSELNARNLITPEEENDFGPDFLRVAGKRAREELSPELESLSKRVDAMLELQVGQARTRMMDDLAKDIPNWLEINRDEKFLSWLALPEPYSGAIRHELLKRAFEQNDTPRVAAFFRGFLAEEAALTPAPSALVPSAEPVPPAPKVKLEDLAAPGRAKTAAPMPAEKPIISRADITKFYADVAAGRYRGKDADKLRIENMIVDAGRDGRIRN